MKFRHEVDLAAAIENVHALLGGDHGVAVEIGCPLLELSEVFHAFQRPLRAEQPLDVYSAKRGRVQAVAELLRPDVAHQVRRGVGVPVDVAIKANHALAWFQRAAVVRGVELLLGERRQQEPQTLQLSSDSRFR